MERRKEKREGVKKRKKGRSPGSLEGENDVHACMHASLTDI